MNIENIGQGGSEWSRDYDDDDDDDDDDAYFPLD